MIKLLRIIGATVTVVIVVAIGTFHAIGYQDAFARVEDVIGYFNPGIPSAIEPYGLNNLLKTTRVRYNDAYYQVSFSSTNASPEQVVEEYSKYLVGPKVMESSEDGEIRNLYHFDGQTLTGIIAMPIGPNEPGTLVQKVHTVKAPRDPSALPELRDFPQLAPLVELANDESLSDKEKQLMFLELARDLVGELKAHEQEAAGARRHRDTDRPGFDIASVPRYPGSVRLSSMGLEDGRIQIVRYSSADLARDVARFFLETLPSEGWILEPLTAAAIAKDPDLDYQHLVFNQGGAGLNITLTPSNATGDTIIAVMLQ